MNSLLLEMINYGENKLLSEYEKLHAINCSYIIYLFLKDLNYDKEKAKKLSALAYVHDIGKAYIPSQIVNKSEQLTEEEFKIIKKHSAIGEEIMSKVGYFDEYKQIILQHHENIDGSGYPRGLKNDEILIEAQILTLVDVFEAICSKRCYKDTKSIKEALLLMQDDINKKFEPKLFYSFKNFILQNEIKINNILVG